MILTKKELELIKHRIDDTDKNYSQLTQTEKDRKQLYECVMTLKGVLRQDTFDFDWFDTRFIEDRKESVKKP